MALNAKQGQEMVDACKAAGVKLLVGYRMHFEPHTLEVIRMRKLANLVRSYSSRAFAALKLATLSNGG
jgi:predicted dehydrogenase